MDFLEGSSNQKTQIIKDFIAESPQADLYLLCKLLLAKNDTRVYHLADKKIIKLFAAMLGEDAAQEEKKLLLGGDASVTCAEMW